MAFQGSRLSMRPRLGQLQRVVRRTCSRGPGNRADQNQDENEEAAPAKPTSGSAVGGLSRTRSDLAEQEHLACPRAGMRGDKSTVVIAYGQEPFLCRADHREATLDTAY